MGPNKKRPGGCFSRAFSRVEDIYGFSLFNVRLCVLLFGLDKLNCWTVFSGSFWVLLVRAMLESKNNFMFYRQPLIFKWGETRFARVNLELPGASIDTRICVGSYQNTVNKGPLLKWWWLFFPLVQIFGWNSPDTFSSYCGRIFIIADFGAMFWFLDQVFKTFNMQQKHQDYGKHFLKRKSVIPKRFLKQISSQHLFWRNHAYVFFPLKKIALKTNIHPSIHPVRTKGPLAGVPKRKWQVGCRTCPDGLALKNTWAKRPSQLRVVVFVLLSDFVTESPCSKIFRGFTV